MRLTTANITGLGSLVTCAALTQKDGSYVIDRNATATVGQRLGLFVKEDRVQVAAATMYSKL